MRKFVLIFFSVICFLFVFSPVFAVDPPTQTSPDDGLTVTTTTMKWGIPSYSLYSGKPYQIQVDDDQAFVAPKKDYYTDNNFYTPTGLNMGLWYWRVKAKDSVGVWSDWSSIWSFMLVSPTPTPIPTDVPPTPTDEPTPTKTPTPTKAPTPTKTPTPTKKPTIAPTKLPSNQPTSTPIQSGSTQIQDSQDNKVTLPQSILGSSTDSADISPTPTTTENNAFSFKSLVFIAGGIILILLGIFIFTFVAKDRFKKI